MNKIAWVIESVRDLAVYLNIQQYTTNIRCDNIWFSCVLQVISGSNEDINDMLYKRYKIGLR